MPLNEGAQPGSKEFSENVAAEVKAGKPQKQAVAIAYSEARNDMSGPEFKKLTDLLDEFFKEESQEPEHKNDAVLTLDLDDEDGQFTDLIAHIKRAASVGHSFEVIVDPGDADYEKKFFIDGDGAFRIREIDARQDAEVKTDGAVLMDALSTLRGRVEVAASKKA